MKPLLLIPRENLACPTLCPSGKAGTPEAMPCRAPGAGDSDRTSPSPPDRATTPPPPSLMQPRRPFQRLLPWSPELIPHRRPGTSRQSWAQPPVPTSGHPLALHHRADHGQISSRVAVGGQTSLGSSEHPHPARSGPASPAPPGPGSTRAVLAATSWHRVSPGLPDGQGCGGGVGVSRAGSSQPGWPGSAPPGPLPARDAEHSPGAQPWHVGSWHSSRCVPEPLWV